MEWKDIKDRRGMYEFIGVGKILSGLYFPEDIQSLVDTLGVPDTVHIINERYQQLYHKNAVSIVNHSGQLKVIQA